MFDILKLLFASVFVKYTSVDKCNALLRVSNIALVDVLSGLNQHLKVFFFFFFFFFVFFSFPL